MPREAKQPLSPKSHSEPTSPGYGTFRRSQHLMSQMLSMLIPTSTEDMIRKYPSLLDVPFISQSEILLTREIGSGSFGRVFHGIFSFQDVAVKRLTVRNFRDEIDIYDQLGPDDGDEADKKARQVAETLLALEKEVAMLKRISFPKVVGFYGVCFEPAAIVTEYCARGSLFDLIGKTYFCGDKMIIALLARARSSSRVAQDLSWERRLRLANDAAIGMSFLHSGMDPIIHRDLKSPNLLVDEHYNCKVADFNTAGFVNATEITKSQANNPRWLAPEIADNHPHTTASDVYGFGIILWELMTWMRPFEYEGEQITTYNILIGIVRDQLRPDIIPNDKLLGGPCPVYDEYVELMKECWDQDPDRRPDFVVIHEKLEIMMKKVAAQRRPKSTPYPHPKERIVRETSPEPRPTRSPRCKSPFSDSPLTPPPGGPTGVTRKARGMRPPETTVADEAPTPEQEACPISPFQNGPPSESSGTTGREGAKLANPPSFSTWSERCGPTQTRDTSGLFDYSDVVQTRGSAEKSDSARKKWRNLSVQLGLDDIVVPETRASPAAFQRWDSIRTAIFGDPTTDDFQEQFASFLKGDETAELKKRLNSIENKGSPGLRILRALMDLREKRERGEEALDEKPSGWCLVKHLMLINLPTTVHPMWQLASQDSHPSQTFRHRASQDSMLESIAEDISQSASNGTGAKQATDASHVRAKRLWRKVRKAFTDEDTTRGKMQIHPLWKQLREMFFSYDDEVSDSVQGAETPSVPSPSSSRDADAVVEAETPRKRSGWHKVQKVMFGEEGGRSSTMMSDVVKKNWQFLANYAKTSLMEKKNPLHPEQARMTPSKIRSLPIVDEEPPSDEKWNVVRGLLLDVNLGKEWVPLSEKAARNVDPPRGAEWEIFRWLFFENKKLRNQPNWILIKDLFLKTDAQIDYSYS